VDLRIGGSFFNIPTGFHIKAQGCRAPATLGVGAEEYFTPTGLCPGGDGPDMGRNPVGVGDRVGRLPQGRRDAPTLGYGTEPRCGIEGNRVAVAG